MDITLPPLSSLTLGREKKKDVGSVWISCHPIVFVNAQGEEEEENVGSVWISCCPVVFIDAGGERRKMWAK